MFFSFTYDNLQGGTVMVGIIDIGSNTIRLVMYEKGKKLCNIAANSEILQDTVDGHLTKEGTQKLCETITFLKNEAKGEPVYAIATFAFRVLENCEEVKKEIYEKTGVKIEILSGKDEAKCDFAALIKEIGREKNGIGVDLGGGSAQIFTFEKENLLFFESYPIGAKIIKKIFVEDVFPTETETEEIKKYIGKYVNRVGGKSKDIYIMGGTAKTAFRIYTYIKGTQNIRYIEAKDINSIIEFIKEAPEDLIKNVLRSRYDNIVCGIMVIAELAKTFESERIYVLPCGVREGYLLTKNLKNEEEGEKADGIN